MTLRLWRRFRIVPGLRVNASRSGLSLSIGRRGAWFTLGPRGRRATIGLPGTGLFWTEHSRRAIAAAKRDAGGPAARPMRNGAGEARESPAGFYFDPLRILAGVLGLTASAAIGGIVALAIQFLIVKG